MLDHNLAAQINQERMSQVYQQLSTYRNAKVQSIGSQAPDDPLILNPANVGGGGGGGGGVQQDHHQLGQDQQQKQPQQPVSSSKEEILMPAPMYTSQQAYAASQLGGHHQRTHQDGCGVLDRAGVEGVGSPPQQPQQQNTPSSDSGTSGAPTSSNPTASTDAELEVDLLTPSIDNYQPQVVSETLQRDAFLQQTQSESETQPQELDVYRADGY